MTAEADTRETKEDVLYPCEVIEELRETLEVDTTKKRSLLARLVLDPELLPGRIEQLNRMWAALPGQNLRDRSRMLTWLRSFEDNNFRGAWGQLCTGWVLQYFCDDVIAEPEVAGVTPDYFARAGSDRFLVESIFLARDRITRRDARTKDALLEELEGLEANYFIFLHGSPVPNENGTFEGIREALRGFLSDPRNLDPASDEILSIEANGAHVFFQAHPATEPVPVYGGSWSAMRFGSPNVRRLLNRLDQKLTKYEFPFLFCCVLESKLDLSPFSLTEVLIGKPGVTFTVSRDPSRPVEVDPQPTNTNDGLWGTRNSAFARNLRLQGLLLITISWQEDGSFLLQIRLAENPHISGVGRAVFNDIPEILAEYHPEEPSLVLRP